MSEEIVQDEEEQAESRSQLTTLLDMLCTLESEQQRSQVIRDMPSGHECDVSFEVVEVHKEIPGGRGGEAGNGGCLVLAKICDTRDEEEVESARLHSDQEVEILVPQHLASQVRRWEPGNIQYGVVSLQDWDVVQDRYQLRLVKSFEIPRWVERLLVGITLMIFGPIFFLVRGVYWFLGIGAVVAIACVLGLFGQDPGECYALAGMLFFAGFAGSLFRLSFWMGGLGDEEESEEEPGEKDRQDN